MTPPQCPTTEAPGPYFQKDSSTTWYIKSLKKWSTSTYARRVRHSRHVRKLPAGKVEKGDLLANARGPKQLDPHRRSLGLTDHEEDLIVIFIADTHRRFSRNPTPTAIPLR